eukprot:TRINITY_DN694_c0_g1_i3.p1 TRINITY_DN694_c0_g1~~TRINITY_DN694_c0_g1_i3.p1  ORF type:complete len:539 (+),score=177.24 TRINITY_DN694_c0_g1_i3:2488-4104(+)
MAAAGGRNGWLPDAAAVECQLCAARFGFFQRKHHCRSCGQIFCDACCRAQIELGAASGLVGPQRVCTVCYKLLYDDHKEKARLLEHDSMLVQFFLRDVPRFDFDRILPFIGGRRDKSYSLVRGKAGDYVLSLAPTDKCPVPLSSDARRQALCSLLLSLQGPYVLPTVHCAHLSDRQRLVVVRPWCPAGSLADLVYQTVPSKPALDKYPSSRLASGPRPAAAAGGAGIRGVPLPERDVQRFGYQILQGMMWLKALGIPLPGLHIGNVLVRDGNACLSEIENAFLGFEPAYRRCLSHQQVQGAQLANIELVLFGHVLFHISTGFALAGEKLQSFRQQCPPAVYEVLSMIFPEDASAPFPKPRNVCAHPFFDGPRKALQPPLPSELRLDKPAAALVRNTAEFTGWLLAPDVHPRPVPADSPAPRRRTMLSSSSSTGSDGNDGRTCSRTPAAATDGSQPTAATAATAVRPASVPAAPAPSAAARPASQPTSQPAAQKKAAASAPAAQQPNETKRNLTSSSSSSSSSGSRSDLLADIRKLRKD